MLVYVQAKKVKKLEKTGLANQKSTQEQFIRGRVVVEIIMFTEKHTKSVPKLRLRDKAVILFSSASVFASS